MSWLAAEYWADIFKLLPRNDLCRIQSVDTRFKAICECHVNNVHVIRRFTDFMDALANELPEANQHLNDLVGSKADLSTHFRIEGSVEIGVGRHWTESAEQEEPDDHYERRFEKQKLALAHSLELFSSCQLYIYLTENASDNTKFDAILAMEQIQPFCIHIGPQDLHVSGWGRLLAKPVVLECNRVTLSVGADNSEPNMEELARWLHLRRSNGTVVGETETRLLNVPFGVMMDMEGHCCWVDLIECCVEDFQRGTSPSDRCQFVLSFTASNLPLKPFSVENRLTGEVLLLEDTDIPFLSIFFQTYRLRRCLAEQATESDSFYEQMFDDSGDFKFIDEEEHKQGQCLVFY